MNYKRRMKVGAFLGLVAAAILGAALTHDNIHGAVLLIYPAGLIVGLVIAHLTAVRKVERDGGVPPTPQDYFKATRKP
jgi:hypothetical protein